MALKKRGLTDDDIAVKQANNELTDLKRTRAERLAGLDQLILVRHGPVKHVATALVLPAGIPSPFGRGAGGEGVVAPEDIDPNIRQRSEKAAEDMAVAHETSRGWETERVGHLKIGFDVRSLGPADPQTGYRDPVEGIRRIEVKGRTRGCSIRLTTNEWYKATQLADSYWLYVVWDPLGTSPELVVIRNPAAKLDHVEKEIMAAQFMISRRRLSIQEHQRRLDHGQEIPRNTQPHSRIRPPHVGRTRRAEFSRLPATSIYTPVSYDLPRLPRCDSPPFRAFAGGDGTGHAHLRRCCRSHQSHGRHSSHAPGGCRRSQAGLLAADPTGLQPYVTTLVTCPSPTQRRKNCCRPA